ncbi:MAG: hypothetical protein COS47_00390 [Candidatus Nealsonbacteria bacterium CG03_land_8_20_14_0_80_36_12]|uniref:30S ribosomal protein S21 n=1 Tax=Candidatus Nealsonbacteria bacterium CG03_land_8_20_14_0_80_36_12 TaxID=1974701 RepID=A0A2M7BYT7_9BACT|nr:MAG: hypothetical protein COS47_00390 [Candidatus Nealsonbacteria bacterium CG03_land_8_20_14_0_80_36_12]
MSFEVKRKSRETSQNLVRRFGQRIRQSGILFRVRASRFQKRTKSRQMKKRAALRKEELRKKYEKLEKLGEIKKRG